MATEPAARKRGSRSRGPARPAKRDREREREDLRVRESARRGSSEQERQQPSDRQRQRRGRHYRAEFQTVVRDVDRMAYAAVRAGASAYIGTLRAVGDLVLNLADSFFAYPIDRDFDYDDDDERASSRSQVRPRRRPAMRGDVLGDVSQAVRDATDAFAELGGRIPAHNRRGARSRDREDRGRGSGGAPACRKIATVYARRRTDQPVTSLDIRPNAFRASSLKGYRRRRVGP